MIRGLVIMCVLATSATAHAQRAPAAVLATGVDEHLGAQLPLATPFTEARTGATTLGRVLDGKHPVLLVVAYARCTMLCSLVLRGVADVARRLEQTGRAAGRDYQLVVITLDARETVDEGRRKQAALVADLGDRGARGHGDDASRWPYLLGSRASIDAVASALGFRYAWDARTEQYAHPAVIFALTPDGRVARYLHGVQFEPADVSDALDDAAAGRILSRPAVEVLRCFHFDPASRRAGARAQRFLQIGAAGVFALLLTLVLMLIRWEIRRDKT